MIDNTGTPLPYLKAYRKRAFLTQRQLASLAGLSRDTILNIERPDATKKWYGVRNDTIGKLAYALDVTPRQLVEEKPI